MLTGKALFDAATIAAVAAAKAEDERLPPENKRGFDCGFAWVEFPTPRQLSPETKAFLAWCKAQPEEAHAGSKRDYGKTAWQFWSPARAQTQSVSVHMAGAQAFALVLRNNGIEGANAGSRLD